jgi:hypothetical protein
MSRLFLSRNIEDGNGRAGHGGARGGWHLPQRGARQRQAVSARGRGGPQISRGVQCTRTMHMPFSSRTDTRRHQALLFMYLVFGTPGGRVVEMHALLCMRADARRAAIPRGRRPPARTARVYFMIRTEAVTEIP